MQIDGVTRAILIPLLADEDTVIVQGMQLERVCAHRLDRDCRGATSGDARHSEEEHAKGERQGKVGFHEV